jgi:hypothetical protein
MHLAVAFMAEGDEIFFGIRTKFASRGNVMNFQLRT